MLFLLYACESGNLLIDKKNYKKDQNIKLKVTSEPSVKIKK